MRRATLAVLLMAIVLVAGCRQKSISKVYPSDMDTTWTAALKVIEAMTGHKPVKADREQGKIATDVTYGKVEQEYNGGYAPERRLEVWCGVITCKPEGSGTKVTIRVQRGYGSTDDRVAADEQDRQMFGYVVQTNNRELQDKFFANLQAELSTKQPAAKPG